MLRHDLTIGVAPMLPIMRTLVRMLHSREVEWLGHFWREARPDLVVSLIPHFNRAIFEGLRIANSAHDGLPTPMVTILTDLADYPPHFWIERQDQFFICGTAFAVQQALEIGCRSERIFLTSGMVVRPEFYQVLPIDREQELLKLGLRPGIPTGLVMFGAFGSRRMVTIAQEVAAAGLKLQLIFLCGHNQQLRERLITMNLPFTHYVEGFTRDVPYFMRLADFFVGKAGPGSISEALVMGLPVVVERNHSTMVQERYNTEWVAQNQVGVVLRSFLKIAEGIAPMLDSEQMVTFRRRVSALNNRAVFEIPPILEALVSHRRIDAGALALHP
jgi:1,2-diacylglycerol 3-beta-galactosyltransferase